MNSHHEHLQLDVQVIDGPGHHIVNFTTDLFADSREKDRTAGCLSKLKRILLLATLSLLLFGGTAGVGSDLAYARPVDPTTATLTARN